MEEACRKGQAFESSHGDGGERMVEGGKMRREVHMRMMTCVVVSDGL